MTPDSRLATPDYTYSTERPVSRTQSLIITGDLIDNANDWVRLSTKIPQEWRGPRLSSSLSSVLENQLLKKWQSTDERLIRARL